MGRPRKYHTQEEKLVANRAKSKRYYDKHEAEINKCRRKAYRKLKANTQSNGKEASATPGVIVQKPDVRPVDLWLEQARRVERRLHNMTQNSPTKFLETLTTQFLADQEKDIIHEEVVNLSKLQKSIYKHENEVLMLAGPGPEYTLVEGIRKDICTVVSWVEELLCYAMVDTMEVDRLYREKRFMYQT